MHLFTRGSFGNRKSFVMRLPNAHRDQAIILTLLDTGLRAMELCKLVIGNVDQKTGRVEVKHGVIGGAKGGKGRTVYLGKVARRALWRYLAEREDASDPDAPVFMAQNGRPINPNSLRQLIQGIADRSEVKNAYPHKFRHTFAITYLRSGGDIFTLQSLLGHASLEMVRHYAQIAEVDVEQAHQKPVRLITGDCSSSKKTPCNKLLQGVFSISAPYMSNPCLSEHTPKYTT